MKKAVSSSLPCSSTAHSLLSRTSEPASHFFPPALSNNTYYTTPQPTLHNTLSTNTNTSFNTGTKYSPLYHIAIARCPIHYWKSFKVLSVNVDKVYYQVLDCYTAAWYRVRPDRVARGVRAVAGRTRDWRVWHNTDTISGSTAASRGSTMITYTNIRVGLSVDSPVHIPRRCYCESARNALAFFSNYILTW